MNNYTYPLGFPPLWLVLPFIVLLLLIALAPLFFPHFWHKHYPKIATLLATIVVVYYCSVLKNTTKPVESAAEYIQFIALISALYMATSGILIGIATPPTPLANTMLLFIGALVSNLIGTTGASMLFIRPYIRLNGQRIKPYHVIFFIFIVSNIGGALTPIGDPPLFLGFLKGIPFTWSLIHNSFPWMVALAILLITFYLLDKKHAIPVRTAHLHPSQPILSIVGSKNFIWLAIIIGSVFLDPTIFTWLPVIRYHGHAISFVRESIMLIVALLAYYTTDKKILIYNEFSFGPLKEICFIFIGIFGTMIPALEHIALFAQSVDKTLITPTTLYWGTGIFSSILDNAPTYLNFTAASMAAQGADIASATDVYTYAMGGLYLHSMLKLNAISVAAVFFGAMTYIGNGPNFMIKSVAQQAGIAMPSFGHYLLRFAFPFLFPVLCVIWMLFFH